MAFNHLNGGRNLPQQRLSFVFGHLERIAAAAAQLRATVTAGTTNVEQAFNFMRHLNSVRGSLANVAADPATRDEAKRVFNDTLYDLGAEHTALMAVIDDVLLWFEENFPTGPSGGLDVLRFTGDGRGTTSSYTMAQTGQLGSKLDALIAQIGT